MKTLTRISDEEVSDFGENEINSTNNTPKKMRKDSKSVYTREEDLKILQYIVKHKTFHRVKSRSLWQEMEKKNVCSGRTWQSMKERLKYIVQKIKTYHLSELNQSSIIDGYNNPNSFEERRLQDNYSSTDSEIEDVFSDNQNKKKLSMISEKIDNSNSDAEKKLHKNAALLSNEQIMLNKCGHNIADQQCIINQVTSTDNLGTGNPSCDSNKLMTFSNVTISDETFHPAISSTVFEIENGVDDTINGRKETFNDQMDDVNYSQNLSASAAFIISDDKSSDKENLFNIRPNKLNSDNENVETILNNLSGSDYEHEIDKDVSCIEKSYTEDENSDEIPLGINILLCQNKTNNNSSLSTERNMSSSKITENESRLVDNESQSMANEEENTYNIADAETTSALECPQSLKNETHTTMIHEDKDGISFNSNISTRYSNKNVDRNDSKLVPFDDELSSDNDSDKTLAFTSDEDSLISRISLKRRNKKYLTRSKVLSNTDPDDKSETELDGSKYLGHSSKYTLTFHGKNGCKRKLIQSHSRHANRDSKFSIDEDLNIIKYIYKYNAIDCINGKEMWISMMERATENNRTWQSLKDRFNKRIFPNIKFYENEGVSKKIIDLFSREYKRKKPYVVEENLTPDANDVFPRDRFYRQEEKQAIVDYIIKTQRYSQIKGNILYQMMAKKMQNKRKRSWQSLQNTFKKYIMPNIKDYVESKDVLSKFEAAWKKSRRRKRGINFKRPPSIYSDSSESESLISATRASSSPLIQKIQRSSNENEKNTSSSSSKKNVGIDSNCENLRKEPSNVDIYKGRNVVIKRKLFTEKDELFEKTPSLGAGTSRIQKSPHKKKEDPSASSKNGITSSKTKDMCSDLMDMKPCTDSINKCEAIHEEATNSQENDTLSKKGDMPLAFSSNPSQSEIKSCSKILEVRLHHIPCNNTFEDEINTNLLSSEKKSGKIYNRERCDQKSPSNSESTLKLKPSSNRSPGRHNKNNQSLDVTETKLRPKRKPDCTLRSNLRVRKLKDRNRH